MIDQAISHEFVSRSICVQQQVSHMLPQLVQLKEGLASCKLLYSVQKYPQIWEPVFVPHDGAEVTGSTVLSEIEPIYSESQVKRQRRLMYTTSSVNLFMLWQEMVRDTLINFCQQLLSNDNQAKMGKKAKMGNDNMMDFTLLYVKDFQLFSLS